MARTRAQDKDSNGQAPSEPKRTPEKSVANDHTKVPAGNKKRQHDDGDSDKATGGDDKPKREKSQASKKAKSAESPHDGGTEKAATGVDKAKLDAIMEAYGVLPLSDSGFVDAKEAKPETILALVYMAMLTSARISHELAYKSVKCLLEAGYHNLSTLKNSTWQERTEVLTDGGYTRYREKTATALGELADFVEAEYDGDLNNLLKRADSSPSRIRSLLQEIKGIGKVGTDIFCDAAQAAWPSLAPFVDPRSMETAKHCGLGSDIGRMWEAVGKDPVEMCKLSSALTMVRLDKKESDFK